MRYLNGLIIIFICLFGCDSWAELENQKTISGTVTQTDWDNSTITVRYFPDSSIDADEVNLIIPNNTQMHRGTDTISFSDIELFDKVNVTYFNDGFSGLKVKTLADLNSGNK